MEMALKKPRGPPLLSPICVGGCKNQINESIDFIYLLKFIFISN